MAYVSVFLCIYAILITWIRQYYTAAAKKQAVLAKHSNVPNSCLLEKQGWFAAAQNMIRGLFDGKSDPCEAYYTAAMVDPAFEVGLGSAILETFSVCIILPAQTVGQALGSYYTCLLEPLPLVWKVPVLLAATVLVVLLMLISCGYEFKIPFLLSITPKSKSNARLEDRKGTSSFIEADRGHHRLSYGNSPWKFERHPSEECDMTDKGSSSLPYPVGRTNIDDLVDGPSKNLSEYSG